MRTAPLSAALVTTLATLALGGATTSAATISLTSATGSGADTTIRRNDTSNQSASTTVVMKKAGDGEKHANDRLALLKFDTTSLAGAGPISNATLRLRTGGVVSTGDNGNSFVGGHVLQLYGVPDRHANENFNAATVTFANFGLTTGTNANHERPAVDVVNNNIDDTIAILLGQYVFPSTPQYQPIDLTFSISTVPLTQFLATNTNGIASFVLASFTTTPGQTPAIYSGNSSIVGARPTLIVQTAFAEVAVPEPGSVAMLVMCGLALSRRPAR